MKAIRSQWVSIALGLALVTLVVGAGIGFAFARSIEAQPPAPVRAASSKVFLRMPYLLQPRTDSIIIAWLTRPGVTDASVAYGLGGKQDLTATVRVHPQEDGVLHSAVLTGLKPGSSYSYAVHSGGE